MSETVIFAIRDIKHLDQLKIDLERQINQSSLSVRYAYVVTKRSIFGYRWKGLKITPDDPPGVCRFLCVSALILFLALACSCYFVCVPWIVQPHLLTAHLQIIGLGVSTSTVLYFYGLQGYNQFHAKRQLRRFGNKKAPAYFLIRLDDPSAIILNEHDQEVIPQ